MMVIDNVRFLDRRTPPHIVTLTLLAGVSALNTSIFLPSLATMADYFQTDYAVMQFAVSGYLLATALLQILIGPISDIIGRRKIVLWSLVIFIGATIGAVLATTIEVFMAFRLAQAVIAGGIVLSRAMVRDMVPGAQAASMIGYVTMGMSLAPLLGPVIGGALDQAFGWQATFVFLILCGLLVLALCWRDLGETMQGRGVGLREQLRNWPELLRSPTFWGYVAASSLGSGAFFALLGGGSFAAEHIFGLTPIWTGAALGISALGYAVGNGLSGRWSIRLGIDKMALIGTIVSVAGMGLSLILTLLDLTNAVLFFGLSAVLGLGNGLLLPNATAGSLSVRPDLAGTAGGLGSAFAIGGGAAMSALAGILLTDTSGLLPLPLLMFASSVLALLSLLFVIRRAARFG